MNLTRDIASRAMAIQWPDLPPEVQRAARLCLADGLAVMLGAVALEPAAAPFSILARAAPGPATLLAGGCAQPAHAALANGALSHALDFEDTFDRAGLHPNAAAIPAVLALAEARELNLGAALTALALGADLACRIGLALSTDPGERGWYHPPMIGAAGAALAGAHLLRLDPVQTASALSLTQTQFALTDALKRSPATHLRAVRDGFAARAAVEAVLLAEAGVIGSEDPLAEPGGLIALLTGSAPDTRAFDGFGVQYLTPGITLKPWPCCRGTHPVIALALALRAEGVGAADIEAVEMTEAPPNAMLFEPRADRIRPQTAIAAKFSTPFTFAAALVHGTPGLHSFGTQARNDPAIVALAARVTLRDCRPGNTPTAHLRVTGGSMDRPLPAPPSLKAGATRFADLAPKFRDCLGAADRLEDRLALLLALETADTAMPLLQLTSGLAAPSSTPIAPLRGQQRISL